MSFSLFNKKNGASLRGGFLSHALLLALVCPYQLQAETDQPNVSLKGFYKHLSKHECAAADGVAEGNSVVSCQNLSALKPPSSFERMATSSEHDDKVIYKIRLEYTLINPPESYACDYAVTVVKKTDNWVVKLPEIPLAKCLPSIATGNTKPTVSPPVSPPPELAEPPSKETPSKPTPDIAPPPIQGLLALWDAKNLRGIPGEEHIRALAKPDLDPPEYLETSEHLPPLATNFQQSIRRVKLPADKKWVALTFDLCEQADDVTGYDRGIVNYLRDQQISATFFASGKWMRSHPERTMQLMADPHFELGNHGWTHGNLRVLTGKKMLAQIVWTQAEYERLWGILESKAKTAGMEQSMQAIPKQPKVLRFPYGTCNADSLRTVNSLGLGAIQWDVVSGDAAPRMSSAALARGVINNARPGSIIVFHANGRGHGTAAALPKVINALRGNGFSFVTVSQLLQAGEPVAANQCYELKPGDNTYIDAKFGEGTQ